MPRSVSKIVFNKFGEVLPRGLRRIAARSWRVDRRIDQLHGRDVARTIRTLAGLLCPNHVGTWSDHDALFQAAVETFGEFGKAEILDDPKTLVAQHFGQFDRVEQTKPWLAQRSRSRRNGHHIGTAVVR